MYCKYCGEELKDGSRFCGKCGKEQETKIKSAVKEKNAKEVSSSRIRDRLMYKSKGISKKAITRILISIIVDCIIAVTFILLANSKVDGPRELISIGGAGNAHYVSLEQDRFADGTQEVLAGIGYMFLLFAVVEGVMMAMYRVSWTEIYTKKFRQII